MGKYLRNNLVTFIFVTERLHNVNTIEMERDVFQAIADPTRREIIDLLADKSLPVNEVAGNFDISRPAVSKHIKILNECGLVVIRKKGRNLPIPGSYKKSQSGRRDTGNSGPKNWMCWKPCWKKRIRTNKNQNLNYGK